MTPANDVCPKKCTPECNMLTRPDCVEQIAAKIIKNHRIKSDLCDQLETIADSLPNEFDIQAILITAQRIQPVVKTAHEFEEDRMFPYLEALSNSLNNLTTSLERLRYEHWEDESFAEEIVERLKDYASDPKSSNAETLAYMLRGFFEGMRRHMAFEREHLLPLFADRGTLQ